MIDKHSRSSRTKAAMAEPGQPVRLPAAAKARRTLAVLIAVALLSLSASLLGLVQTPALAQVQLQAPFQQEPLVYQPQAKPPIDGVPILLDGREVLTLRRGIAGFSLEERAETISRRL
jgi:hypothetical protein